MEIKLKKFASTTILLGGRVDVLTKLGFAKSFWWVEVDFWRSVDHDKNCVARFDE
jgi:hypothetical protein